MMVFVLFLMYQEQQYEEAALQAQEQARLAEEREGPPGERLAEPGPGLGSEIESRRRAGDLPREDPAAGRIAPEPLDETRLAPLESITLENENVVAGVTNGPALVESWRLKLYDERRPEGRVPIDLVTEGHPTLQTAVLGIGGTSFAEARYEIVSSSDREVVQRATSRAGVLTRTLRLDESGYGFELALSFESRLERPVDALFEVRWPVGVSEREDFRELSLLAYSPDDGVSREMAMSVGQAGFFGRLIGKSSTGTQEVEGRAVWAGFDIRYFTGVLIDPEDEASLDVRFEMLEKAESAVAHVSPAPVALGAGGEASRTFRGFFGPKQSEALAAAGSGLEHTINRGWSWLEPLTHLFEIALDKLYAIIPNYGLAIIVLTILVRVLVSPLMVRQMRSAEKMRAVQPRVKALQEKYKDDRQKQSEEMMKLWREEGINPLGGCLPVFLQFPVLIGLFYALQSSIGLRHAPFVLWIDDLSQPATLFTVPGIEFPIRVLPLIMGASMFVQQKMTPTTGMDPAQARMMQIMMPGMMLLISYTFPSGLVLYWTVSNLLGIAHQYWIRNKMQPAT